VNGWQSNNKQSLILKQGNVAGWPFWLQQYQVKAVHAALLIVS
jgi:hypothetical protein